MKIKSSYTLSAANLFLSLCLFCGNAHAQDNSQNRLNALSDTPATLHTASTDTTSSSLDNSNLPDAPQASQQSHDSSYEAAQGEGQQTKRILGIFPNFRAVSANVHLPPQTVGQKFKTAWQDSFDYSSIFLPAAVAGINQATNSTPEFRQGAAGYGRYYWHAFADQAVENFTVEAIFPAITREDNRYYTLGSGGFLKRAGYSISRVVITRNDAGNNTFNISEIVGAGAGAGLSDLYYPSRERTFGNTASKWGSNIGIDAGTFLFHEFWPDINHALFHGRKPTT